MKAPVALAAQLRSLRVAADLTLEALAEKSGISARAISDIERGVSTSPQKRTVVALIEALGLDAAARDGIMRVARAQGRSKRQDEDRSTAIAPHRTADFSGRERELAGVLVALADADDPTTRVILVSGPAGIGKTTMALEAVSRSQSTSSRELFVDLGGFTSAPLSALEVLRALLRQIPGIGESVPTELDEAVRRWQLETELTVYVVLLDNAAHESQIRPVLTLDPRSRVVVTSRRSLSGLEGVRRVSLGPLSEDEAVLMLGRLIPESQSAPSDLRELAALCEYIPLALRIVGSRIASRVASSTGDFLVRMRADEGRLRLLVAGDLAVEGAFALSYDELDGPTASLFRSISVVDGPTFDARIAAAIDGTPVLDIEERLDELTDLGLVEARGGNRYRVHDLLRLFGAARHRRDSGQQGVAEADRRLRHWLLSSLERGGAWFEPERSPQVPNTIGLAFPDSTTAEAWIRLEEPHWWPAMQAASRNGEHARLLDAAGALHWFSELWVEWGHWQRFFELAVASARILGDARLEAMHLGYLVWAQGTETTDLELGLRTSLLAVEAADRSGDAQQRGEANAHAAYMYVLLDRRSDAAEHSRRAFDQFGIAGDLDGAAQVMMTLARSVDGLRDHERALRTFEAVLERLNADEPEESILASNVMRFLTYEAMAWSHSAVGEHSKAIAAATTCMQFAGLFASPIREVRALRGRITVLTAAGLPAAAHTDLDTAFALLEMMPPTGSSLRNLTQLHELRAALASTAD